MKGTRWNACHGGDPGELASGYLTYGKSIINGGF